MTNVRRDSSEISADRTSLVNVVKGLGEYLTADEEDLRRKGRHDCETLLMSVTHASIQASSSCH